MPGEIAMLDRKESEDGLPVFVLFMIVILMQSVLGCFKIILITCLKHCWQKFPPIFRLSLPFPPSEMSCLFLLLGVLYIFLFSFKIHIKVVNSF